MILICTTVLFPKPENRQLDSQVMYFRYHFSTVSPDIPYLDTLNPVILWNSSFGFTVFQNNIDDSFSNSDLPNLPYPKISQK